MKKIFLLLVFLLALFSLAWAGTIDNNIIPIITLNYNYQENGIPRHEPCAATRLTPTLLITAAHCLAGGMSNGNRINAELFNAEDGTEGLVFSNSYPESLLKSNAQVFLYNPNYTDPENIPTQFDFAVVVLDKKMQFNSAVIQNILSQMPANLPKDVSNNIKTQMLAPIKKQFSKQAATYTKFINKPLTQVALLTMTPKGVVEELKWRNLQAYFWNGYPRSTKRDSLIKLNERINRKEGTASHNSHIMLFVGEEFHPGTSGSPIFDTQRKVVVSVASGVDRDGYNIGGLIDNSLCQWAKSHDSNVKCLVRHDGVVSNEQENPNR